MNNYCRECDHFPGAGNKCTAKKRDLNLSLNKACEKFLVPNELEIIAPGEPLFPETKYIEFLKIENGKSKVINKKPKGSSEGINLVMEVIELQKDQGKECPYSFRYV